MNKLTVRVSARTDNKTGEEYFEGTVQLPGLKNSKLAKKDGTTRYSSRSLVTQAAKRIAENFSLSFESEENETQIRKAAKKSVKKTNDCCGGNPCSWA